MLKISLFFIILFFYTLNANSERYNYPALKWIKSTEYKLLCSQVYQSAQQEFDKLDLNTVTSVMLEHNTKKRLPLAVITDIDETILLNYDLQKKILKDNVPFSYNLFKYILI